MHYMAVARRWTERHDSSRSHHRTAKSNICLYELSADKSHESGSLFNVPSAPQKFRVRSKQEYRSGVWGSKIDCPSSSIKQPKTRSRVLQILPVGVSKPCSSFANKALPSFRQTQTSIFRPTRIRVREIENHGRARYFIS